MEIITLILGTGGILGGVVSIVLAVLKRRWTKQDKRDEKEDKTENNTEDISEIKKTLKDITTKINNITQALKVSMAYDINNLAECCIYDERISLANKETLITMHNSYKTLDGPNGLCTVMSTVETLPVVPNQYGRKERNV